MKPSAMKRHFGEPLPGPNGQPLLPGEISFKMTGMCSCGCGKVYETAQMIRAGDYPEMGVHQIATRLYRMIHEMDQHGEPSR